MNDPILFHLVWFAIGLVIFLGSAIALPYVVDVETPQQFKRMVWVRVSLNFGFLQLVAVLVSVAITISVDTFEPALFFCLGTLSSIGIDWLYSD